MYVERNIFEKFNKLKNIYPVIALVGARQAGKTTFLKKHIEGNSYVFFDDPDAREIFEEDIKLFEKQYIKDTTILDEVHYCKDAGRKLKYLADKGHKLWITSSSEIILNKNVISYLVGRISIISLYPFSFYEFLKSKNINVTNKNILKRSLWEHITYGGYPKVITTDDFELKKIILKDLNETMILKDIARNFNIRDINSLEKFVKYISINNTCILSYDKISDVLNISYQTIVKYLDAMEKNHLITKIKPFFKNKNKEIAKQPKIYFIDTGLRNIIINSFKLDIDGEIFENYVLSEIVKNGFEPKFWRTKLGSEMDFIIENGEEIIPIEIKLKSNKVSKCMKSFIDEYKPKKCFVVNYNNTEREVKINDTEIFFVDIKNFVDHISLLK